MKLIKTEDAAGQVLCHDVTRIIKDVQKGPAFKKGHVITKEDIPVLLNMGKENIYIWEINEDMLHENDAALILYGLCKSENMHPSDISEGKIEIIADIDGLLKVDSAKLNAVNSLGEMMIASRHGNFAVKKGEKIAGTRIIPLVIEKEKMERAKEAALGGRIFKLLPFRKRRAGIVTTGSEVFYHRIEDTFTPVIKDKLSEFDVEIVGQEYSPDDPEVKGDRKPYPKGRRYGNLYRRNERGS